jgi:hypothetical protein
MLPTYRAGHDYCYLRVLPNSLDAPGLSGLAECSALLISGVSRLNELFGHARTPTAADEPREAKFPL